MFMDKAAIEARIRTIYGLTICCLPVLSAQARTPKTAYSVTGSLYMEPLHQWKEQQFVLIELDTYPD